MPEVVYDSNILLVFCLPVRFRYSQKWVSLYVPEVIFLLYIIKHIVLVRLSEILADQKNGRVKASVKWKSVIHIPPQSHERVKIFNFLAMSLNQSFPITFSSLNVSSSEFLLLLNGPIGWVCCSKPSDI